ncbi:hypothetical protein GDO78_022753 [Eleutherodactylus coqui]|uniref:Uncharacterized protein n=1 Tax=Eleutherodactylus coqui TaxID=57060 RepID=A0A8J6C1R0_ELECQ|nr:hypothetical protein GDO78_022753 [Eleutherodactylus coqui]
MTLRMRMMNQQMATTNCFEQRFLGPYKPFHSMESSIDISTTHQAVQSCLGYNQPASTDIFWMFYIWNLDWILCGFLKYCLKV